MADQVNIRPGDSQIQRHIKRYQSLRSERASWEPQWRDLGDYIYPNGVRLNAGDHNRGDKKYGKIINSAAVRGRKILRAGMHGGLTSPARPWFQLTTADQELSEFGSVREYLDFCTRRIRHAFALSNIYRKLAEGYGYLGTFGQHLMLVDEDDKTILRAYNAPIGTYCLASSSRGVIDTCFREFTFTVGSVVKEFGAEKCSRPVRDAYDAGRYDEEVQVLHVVEPNPDYREGFIGNEGKPFLSFWIELGKGTTSGGAAAGITPNDPQTYLREKGYDENPIIAPRWEVIGQDTYGSGAPGQEALGDAKAVQTYERRKAKGIDMLVNPPMKGPTSLRNTRVSLLPGDFTPVNELQGGKLEPSVVVDARGVQFTGMEIKNHEERIYAAFHADLFRALIRQEGGPAKTATEIAQLHEEKLLQLGPVLGSLDDELLTPLIERAFGALQRRGLLPPPPEEIQGMKLEVRYISVLAAAQRLVEIPAQERLRTHVAICAEMQTKFNGSPVLDKFDFDQSVDEMSELLGVKPGVIRTDDKVEEIRAARAQRQQQLEQAAAVQQAAAVAKDLGSTPTDGDNALTNIAKAMSPLAQDVGAA